MRRETWYVLYHSLPSGRNRGIKAPPEARVCIRGRPGGAQREPVYAYSAGTGRPSSARRRAQ